MKILLNRILLTLIFVCKCEHGLADKFTDFDVEWPPSNEPGIHLLLITVDGCQSKFKIKNDDFYKFISNPNALTQAVKEAIEKANSDCSD